MTINKILVTGARGFIGSHICAYFDNNKKYKVIPYNERLASTSHVNSDLNDLLKKEQPHFIIHCAGSSSVAHSFLQPQEDFHKSVIVTEWLLETIAKNSPNSKFIYLSSAAVYGSPEKMPIDENHQPNPISPYGYHKLICEHICKKYYNIYHIPLTILRIFSVYGPCLKKQILWDIFQKNNSHEHENVLLQGTGTETRDFIYIFDLMRVIHTTLKSDFNFDIINVATGKEITIERLAKIMLSSMKSTKKLEFTGLKKCGDPPKWSVNIDRLQKMGMTQWTPIEKGIQQYVNWLLTTKVDI